MIKVVVLLSSVPDLSVPADVAYNRKYRCFTTNDMLNIPYTVYVCCKDRTIRSQHQLYKSNHFDARTLKQLEEVWYSCSLARLVPHGSEN